MDIARRDLAALSIKTALDSQQKQLQCKYNSLKKETSTNKLLVGIVKDYATHLDFIKKQKKAQYDGLKKISDYIDRISQDTETTEQMLRQTKQDQHEIMNEMNGLRNEINKIIVDDKDIA